MSNDWKFQDPKDTSVFTTVKVLKEGKPILHVFHEEDASWQFHAEGAVEQKDAMLVSLEEIVGHDPSVISLADLPPGWTADRESVNDEWVRSVNKDMQVQ